MQENWKEIPEFPGYIVSDQGRVRNADYDRPKIPSQNQSGVMHVLLMRNTMQYRRSLAKLVAEAFLEAPPRWDFTTLIHLDGQRSNCSADNLVWRPRWFARRYHRQFEPGAHRGFDEPVVEVHSGETFETSWEAALKYGLLDEEIKIAALNRTYVFPTGQIFRTLDI